MAYERQQTFNIIRPEMYHLADQRFRFKLNETQDLPYIESLPIEQSSERSLITNSNIQSILKRPEMYYIRTVNPSIQHESLFRTNSRRSSTQQKKVQMYMLGNFYVNPTETKLPSITPPSSVSSGKKKKATVRFNLNDVENQSNTSRSSITELSTQYSTSPLTTNLVPSRADVSIQRSMNKYRFLGN